MTKPPTVNGQTLHEWITEWLGNNAPGLPFNLPKTREDCYAYVPRGFMPSLDDLQWRWFVDATRRHFAPSGHALIETPGEGLQVVNYRQLPLNDFFEVCLRKARLVSNDWSAIRLMVEDYRASTNARIDVDQFMARLRTASGF